jgi:hypothetical protein
MSAGSDVRLALIGCGTMGRLHAGHAASDPACRVTLYVDQDLGRAEQLASRFGGVATTDYRRALDDPHLHGVILTVPDPLHAALAIEALAAGKHVMMEKPISVTLADADGVIAAAERAKRIVFVAHVLRSDRRCAASSGCSPLGRWANRSSPAITTSTFPTSASARGWPLRRRAECSSRAPSTTRTCCAGGSVR